MGGESKLTDQSYAVVFPGQGAQAPSMGTPWRDHASWEVVERAEKILERPLAPLLLGDPEVDLSRTSNSQISVLLVSLMGWEALRDQVPPPRAFAGHSLGQITALIAAGALAFDDGIKLAARRAELTQRDADARPGRMAALLGATPEQAEQACAEVDECWVANDNTIGQVVLAGTPEGVAAASEAAKEAGVRRVMALDVGGAFHTPLFDAAARDLESLLAELDWRDTEVGVISNGDASLVTQGREWSRLLSRHLTEPVRWRACMDSLLGASAHWVEIGPGTTLAAFAKRAHPDVAVSALATPDDLPVVIDRINPRTDTQTGDNR